jgi:hypothetical protein
MARNQAVLRALSGKLNLGVLCGAVSAAALLESTVLLALGMAAFFGLVARDLTAEGRSAHFHSPRIPDGASFENMAIRVAIDGIGAAQKERLEAIKTCPDAVLRMLDDLLRNAVALETAALGLAKRTDQLHGYLSRKDLAGARDTLYSAQQSAQLARTPREREIYDAAAKSHAAHVETLSALENNIRVALAKLEHMRATLAIVPPRIVKLSAASADMADTSCLRLADDLCAATLELQEAEERFQMLALEAPEDAYSEPLARRHRPGVRVAAAAADPGDDVIELEDPTRAAHRTVAV